nr:uncharacterized protein LOC109165874 [Ipomoea batatas]
MNSKTLSNVRTAEALDQIQRDTKKTKHIPGDPGTSAMEITEEEAASEGIGSQTIESIEVVAETPLENQKAMEYSASEAGQGEESQTAMANALNPTATLAMSNQAGNTPARSYLDTVVGNGTGGELGDSDRTNALEEPDQNQVATHTVTNVGGEAVAWPSTKGAHPYGSWMIATRRERRQQGGQGDCPNEGAMQRATNGKGKGGATGTGSRFALLENAEENEGPEPQVEAEATGNPTTDSRGELGDSDRTNALEEPDQNQVATHTVTNVGGEAVAWPSTKGAHPYGSWMIATRRERRQQGGQGDCPNEGAMQRATNGKGKGGATGTGSRFALLENAEENEGPEPQVEAEATGNPTTDSLFSPSALDCCLLKCESVPSAEVHRSSVFRRPLSSGPVARPLSKVEALAEKKEVDEERVKVCEERYVWLERRLARIEKNVAFVAAMLLKKDAQHAAGTSTPNKEAGKSTVSSSYLNLNPQNVGSGAWVDQNEMRLAFVNDPQLCLTAVCALYRNLISAPLSNDQSGVELAKYLIDGHPENKLNRAVSDISKVVTEESIRLALKYKGQLFRIYSSGEDPLFCHNSTTSASSKP